MNCVLRKKKRREGEGEEEEPEELSSHFLCQKEYNKIWNIYFSLTHVFVLRDNKRSVCIRKSYSCVITEFLLSVKPVTDRKVVPRKSARFCLQQEIIIKRVPDKLSSFFDLWEIESKSAWVLHLINCTFISCRVLSVFSRGSRIPYVLLVSSLNEFRWDRILICEFKKKKHLLTKRGRRLLVMSFCCLEG